MKIKLEKIICLMLICSIVLGMLPTLGVVADDGVIGPPPSGGGTPPPPPSGGGEIIMMPPGDSGDSSGGDNYYHTDVHVNVEVNLNANTLVMDLAQFILKGLPYEMQGMKKYLKNTPEYKYGDIIEFKEDTFRMSGRDFLEYEEPLVRDGIVRHPNDIVYSLTGIYFKWNRGNLLKIQGKDKISKTYFLASMARNAGLIDDVYISTRSKATMVPDTQLKQTRMQGRQKIEITPYQKEVQGQVDIAQNIVLVDYDFGEYSVVKLDNIYEPYINYLVDLKVVDRKELVTCTDGHQLRASTPGIKDMLRLNYNSISHSEAPINPESNKDWGWPTTQVTVTPTPGPGGNLIQENLYKGYFYSPTSLYNCTKGEHHEYKLTTSGNYPDFNEYKLEAKVPKLTENENITVLEALEYMYKYVWYKETETTLNKLEVDTIISLYGMKLTNYTDREIEILKYLIAKGIVDPHEDNLEMMRSPLLYEDLLKYLFRLNYPEKRFDFKKLSLTGEDIRMIDLGYMQDRLTLMSNSSYFDDELEGAKETLINTVRRRDQKLGSDRIYLEIPVEEVLANNYILSSSQDYNAKFEIIPISIEGTYFGMVDIPKSFNKGLVLRSPGIEGGFKITLSSWENKGVYEIREGNKFVRKGNLADVADSSEISMNRYLSNDTKTILQVDINKPVTYGAVPVFVGESGNRTINPNFEGLFSIVDLSGGKKGLEVIGVHSLEELMPILSNIQAPPQLSSAETVFMGYSQISINGEKVTLIRDTDLAKFGVEAIEDNVLYNRDMDLYAYMDLRTSILYYGNSVIQFPKDQLMVTGVPGKDSTFYNLEVVTSLLRTLDNGSIANEVMVLLPPDEEYTVKSQDGMVSDRFYLAYDQQNSLWINSSTLGKKHSNMIFYRDKIKGLDMLINYRARESSTENRGLNDNSFTSLIKRLQSSGLQVHGPMNPLLQSLLGYKGSFTVKEYNYGIALLYEGIPENIGNMDMGEVEFKQMTAINKSTEIEKSLIKLLEKFDNVDERASFIGSWTSASDFRNINLPIDLLKRVYNEDGFIEAEDNISRMSDYWQKVIMYCPPELRSTVYVSTEAVWHAKRRNTKDTIMPAKVWNNNLYLRFKDMNNFSEIRHTGPYRFLGSLIYLYEKTGGNKEIKVKYEKVNYENTPLEHIPLENWKEGYPIGNLKYIDRVTIDYAKLSKKVIRDDTPYLYNRLAPKTYTSETPALMFEIGEDVEGDFDNTKTLRTIYEALMESNPQLKTSLEDNKLSKLIPSNTEYLRVYLSKSVEGSTNEINKHSTSINGESTFIELIVDTVVTSVSNIADHVKGAWKTVSTWVSDKWNNEVTITETLLKDEGFVFKKNVTYIFKPLYMYPAGTVIVSVGEDYYKELSVNGEGYYLVNSKNASPRVVLGNSFDLINQNIAQLNTESTPTGDIPVNSYLELPTGTQLLALGNNRYLMTRGVKFENSSLDSEASLMWNYLEDLNVKVGTSLNLLNGVISIGLPKDSDISGNTSLSTLVNYFIFKKSPRILYTKDGGGLQTGKVDAEKGLIRDNSLNTDAYVFPAVELDERISTTKMMYTKDGRAVYIVRDLGMSVDPGFSAYLRDGIVDVNVPNYDTDILDLNRVNVGDSNINAFRMKNLLLRLSKFLYILRRALPLIVFAYSISVMLFLLLFSVSITRDFLQNILPTNISILLFKTFSLFSVDEMYDMNIPLGFVKAFVVMVVSIIWWVVQNK